MQMQLELKQDKYENSMFWIEDNESSGIDVDNKRTEEFCNQHLAKMMRGKETTRDMFYFWGRFLRRVRSMCLHFSRAGCVFDCLNMSKEGWLATD